MCNALYDILLGKCIFQPTISRLKLDVQQSLTYERFGFRSALLDAEFGWFTVPLLRGLADILSTSN